MCALCASFPKDALGYCDAVSGVGVIDGGAGGGGGTSTGLLFTEGFISSGEGARDDINDFPSGGSGALAGCCTCTPFTSKFIGGALVDGVEATVMGGGGTTIGSALGVGAGGIAATGGTTADGVALLKDLPDTKGLPVFEAASMY